MVLRVPLINTMWKPTFVHNKSSVFAAFCSFKYTKGDRELLSLHTIQTCNAFNRKKRKTRVFCGSLPIEQVLNKHCISDRSQYTACFVTQVMLIPTECEFLQVVGEWRRCSTHGLATTCGNNFIAAREVRE